MECLTALLPQIQQNVKTHPICPNHALRMAWERRNPKTGRGTCRKKGIDKKAGLVIQMFQDGTVDFGGAMDVHDIPLDLINEPDEPNRVQANDESIVDFASELKRDGLLHPIHLKPLEEGRYEILAGDRRYLAFKLLGEKTIPATISSRDDQGNELIKIQENLRRKQLTSFEEIIAITNYIKRHNISYREAVILFGISINTVANYMSLSEAQDDIKVALHKGDINKSVAAELQRVKDDTKRVELTHQSITHKYGWQTVKNMVDYYIQLERLEEEGHPVGGGENVLPLNLETFVECQMCTEGTKVSEVKSVTMCPKCIELVAEMRMENFKKRRKDVQRTE